MGRAPCCDDDSGVKKGPWTTEEDEKLVDYIKKNGHGSWRNLPKLAGLNRCGKSCRLRWTNYLRPDIKRGKFTEEEDRHIIHLHSLLGNKWSSIAARLPGRTDNEIKNYWNTHVRKRFLRMGIDPVTHRPRADLGLLANLPNLLAAANLGGTRGPPLPGMSDEMMRGLQASAALLKIQLVQNLVQVLTSTSTSATNIDQTAALLQSINSNGVLNQNSGQFVMPQPQGILQQEHVPDQTSLGNIPSLGGTDHHASPSHISDRNSTPTLGEFDTASPATSVISVPPLVSASPDYHAGEYKVDPVHDPPVSDAHGSAGGSSGAAAFDPCEGLDFADLSSFEWNWKDFITASASLTSTSEMM